MSKYKLIKNYPQFEMPLECNLVADGGYSTNSDRVYNPENYPEFWEEIIEENDYAIISFIKNGTILSVVENKPFEGELLDYHLNDELTEIYSIKRLSDNEVFTIGNKVKQSNVIHNNTFTIRGFEFDVNNKHLLVIGNGGIKLSKIEKVKTPIFTTEDNVDIYDNNHKLFEVILNNFHLNENIPLIACNDSKDKRKDGYPSKIFSSKEKAENYIIFNKPCLSINDLQFLKREAIIYWDNKLKDLVKTKL